MKLFVTGTDTGAGKTVVSAALLARARAAGKSALGFKPAESGCDEIDGELHPDDAALLAEVAGHPIACPFRYREPLAPAAASGRPFDLDEALEHWATLGAGVDLAIAEGAGGLLVPLAPGLLVADLVAAMQAPLLIVGRDSLGTINHTALTIEVARARGLEFLGFAFSATGQASAERARANARAVVEQTGARCLGILPHLPSIDRPALERAAASLEPLL